MANRREFLKTSASLATGVALSGFTASIAGCHTSSLLGGSNNKFGIQLYTLRDILPNDPKGILKQLASFGYKQIEGYEGKQGMFWGMKNTDFKAYLNDLGMDFISSHCDYKVDFDKKTDEAAAIGMKYLICPFLGPQKTLDGFKKAAESFNKAGEMCKQKGIRFAYHNHAYSFNTVEGQYPQDVLMQNTDKELVYYEMDMYWVIAAGEKPGDWFKKYRNRFTLGHVKDRKGKSTATLGTGDINYTSILKEAKQNGMEYFMVEQEQYEGTTPLNAAKDNAAYMKKLKL